MGCASCGTGETCGTHKECAACNPNPHGTAAKYSAGCRCEDCREAAREAERLRSAGNVRTKAPHGDPQRYRNGCRCDDCTLASRRHRRLVPHGMAPDDYATILEIQHWECPICETSLKDARLEPHIDHSHNCTHVGRKISCPKCWRGLLCQRCNPHLERKLGHAYLRQMEGLPPTPEDERVMRYLLESPGDILRSRRRNRTDA